MGELWGVCFEDFAENWSCYKGTIVFIIIPNAEKWVHREHMIQEMCMDWPYNSTGKGNIYFISLLQILSKRLIDQSIRQAFYPLSR